MKIQLSFIFNDRELTIAEKTFFFLIIEVSIMIIDEKKNDVALFDRDCLLKDTFFISSTFFIS